MHSGFLRAVDLCFTIKEEIAPRINLIDFEDMYKDGGRPPISPKVLLLVLVMQFIERLSDRAAAHNLRYRLDWKIEYYRDDISIRGISDAQKVRYIREAGSTMKMFINWVSNSASCSLSTLKSYLTMQTVFYQNFTDGNSDAETEPELINVATGKDHVCSPHEDEARYANKGGKGWLGYKAQVAETIGEGEDNVNFVTYAEINDAPDHDAGAVTPFIEDQTNKEIVPSEIYADTHYNSADNIDNLKNDEVELKGPVAPKPKKETNEKNAGFRVNLERQVVECPEGKSSKRFSIQNGGHISATFSIDDCGNCPRKERCKPEKRGKRFVQRPENGTLEERRKLMETKDFKLDMHKRNGIEGTISGLVRGQGLRNGRYRGKAKNRLQLKLAGAAANVIRLNRKRLIETEKARTKAA